MLYTYADGETTDVAHTDHPRKNKWGGACAGAASPGPGRVCPRAPKNTYEKVRSESIACYALYVRSAVGMARDEMRVTRENGAKCRHEKARVDDVPYVLYAHSDSHGAHQGRKAHYPHCNRSFTHANCRIQKPESG